MAALHEFFRVFRSGLINLETIVTTMLNDFSDEYALSLDGLSVALQNSYEILKKSSFPLDGSDYSKLIVNRLRAYYCAQDRIKKFLDKRVAQAGADFFVEAILFSLKLFNEVEELKMEVASERTIKPKRKAIRPDISIWRGDTLLAAIECKTQLGWKRNTWEAEFSEREKKLKEAFPAAKMFLMVMTTCNWAGFGDDPRSGTQLFCLLKDLWPTQVPDKSFDLSIIETPIERLLDQVKQL